MIWKNRKKKPETISSLIPGEENHMKTVIPEAMQAVQLKKDGGPLSLRQIPVPRPGAGEVLIRMAASPINPSDLAFIAGGYGYEKTFPVIPGGEGSGTVVAAGPGLLPKFLLGKRVACAKPLPGNGAWAQYMLTRAALCAPLQKNISMEKGAMLLVNPLTVLAFFEILDREGHTALVNTAAASALGKMMVRMAMTKNIPLINIVRRKEQAELLFSLGAKYVLVSSEAGFDKDLSALAHSLKATFFLDAIGGTFTQQLIDAAPDDSLILLYSNLSREPARVSPHSLWDHNIRVEGFFLGTWAPRQSLLKILRLFNKVQKLAGTDLQTQVYKRLPLSSVRKALDLYQKNMTAGKILLEIEK
jgi:NADPH:quinone reductase-like Zn-dependent oxidoreductase